MTLPCPDQADILRALGEDTVDGELSTHLEECSLCRVRVEALFQDDQLVGALSSEASLSGSASDEPPAVSRIETFKILREIRRGGQGVVYEALDEETGRPVALKTIHASALVSDQRRARFEREITLTAGLDHPGIVTLYRSGSAEDGQLYFAMEYVEGQDLTVMIRELGPARTEAEVRLRLELFLEICEAIAHAHSRGVVHRDLKPSNIRIDPDGHPHVLDFGLAKQIDLDKSDDLTGTVEFVGTMIWAAPEQTPWLDLPLGSWTDVYTLGHLLHWLLTDDHPYSVKGPMLKVLGRIAHTRPKPPSVSLTHYRDRSDLDAIVAMALQKEPRDRYGSVVDLAADCRRLLEGRPVRARQTGSLALLAKMARKHPLGFAAAIVLLVLAAVGGLTMYRQVRSLERAAAFDDLAGVRRAGRPTAFRHPGERLAWEILLSGAPNLGSPQASLEDFPGPQGLLDVLRGVYQTMPVEGTRTLPAFVHLRGLPGGAELAALRTDGCESDRLLRIQLPQLELREQELGLQGVLDWRFDGERDQWFLMTEGVVHLRRGDSTPERAASAESPWFDWSRAAADGDGEPVMASRSWRQNGALELFESQGLDLLSEPQQPGAQALFAVDSEGILSAASFEGDRWSLTGLGTHVDKTRGLSRWNGAAVPILRGSMFGTSLDSLIFERRWLSNQERERPRGSIGGELGGVELGAFVAGLGRAINVREDPRSLAGREGYVHGHSSKIDMVLVDPAGEHFVSVDMDNLMRCWNVDRILGDGLESLSAGLQQFGVNAFAQAGSLLVMGGVDGEAGRVEIMPLGAKTPVASLRTLFPILDVDFMSGRDDLLLLLDDQGTLLHWDRRSTTEAPSVVLRAEALREEAAPSYLMMASDPSRPRLALPAADGGVHLVELAPGDRWPMVKRVLRPGPATTPTDEFSAAAWSPDGEWLALAHRSGALTWMHRGRVVGRSSHHNEAINSLASSPDGRWLAAANDDYTTSLWSWGDTQPTHILSFGHRSPVLQVAFDQDSRRIASGDREGRIIVWDVLTWSDGEPQFLYQIDAALSQGLPLHFARGVGAERLFVGGVVAGGPRVWDPKKLDRLVAGNFRYWSKELRGLTRTAPVQRMARWSEKRLTAREAP